MLSPRGQLRFDRWKYEGEPQPPFTECLRADIPARHWGSYRVPDSLRAALHRVDRRFELIYDPLTLAPGDARPAFFLYSVKIDRNGARDALRLEIPLQWDMDYAWPEGRPRAPGMWLIDAYRAYDNSRQAGAVGYIERQNMERRYKAALKAQAARDKPLIEWQDSIDAELDPYLNKGRLSDALCQDGTQTPNAKKRKVMGLPTGYVAVKNIVVPG